MKFIFIVLAIISLTLASSRFCQGFKVGYEAGYCYEKFGCISPISPERI
jgi:hypothetical protein